MSFKKNSHAFTLIELLIVIAIIGILAGVVLAVIDPAKQRKRSKDAVLRSGMAKVGLIINSYYSSMLAYPAQAWVIVAESTSTVQEGASRGTFFTISNTTTGDISNSDNRIYYTALDGSSSPGPCLSAFSNEYPQGTGAKMFVWKPSGGMQQCTASWYTSACVAYGGANCTPI